MKKLIWIVILLALVGGGGYWYYTTHTDKEPIVTTLPVSRGDIVDAVGATGTLQAVTTVTVGTQVSGIVQDLYTDFNKIVKKGQIIARLEPSLLQTQVDTAQANLENAQANLEKQKVAVNDAQSKLTRAQELSAKQLLTASDLETADMTKKQADAQLKSTQSQIVQAEAALNKAKVDLDHTVITAPIDGIIIKRSVDRGQTVNAGMSAPELFIIAADLTQMQVNANIDESDVGRMRPNQDVTFHVDAYPTETFHGSVLQVRLNPTTVQNVVTYSTVINVPNPDLKLKPGMTANVNIEIARRSNVLRVPNPALRFRPTKDVFEALNQAVPPEAQPRTGRGGGRGGQGGQRGMASDSSPVNVPGAAPQPPGTATPGQAAAKVQANKNKSQAPATAQNGAGTAVGQGSGGGGRGGFANMTPEERQKRMEERMASMSPEQKAAYQQRMKDFQARGGGRGGFGGGQGNAGGATGGRGGRPANTAATQKTTAGNPNSAANTTATSIDAMFAPIQMVETRGRVWTYGANKQLKSIALRLGISDGTYTEVLDDSVLPVGTEVVTNFITPAMASAKPVPGAPSPNGNPLMPAQRGRGPGR